MTRGVALQSPVRSRGHARHAQADARGGKRADLGGQYFRSSDEANFARLLGHFGIPYKYEPTEFIYPIDRGTRTYTPDFQIDLTSWRDGTRSTQGWPTFLLRLSPQLYWVEIKGWMDSKSQTRLSRFIQYYSKEAERLLLVIDRPHKAMRRKRRDGSYAWSPRLVKTLQARKVPVIDLSILRQIGPALGIEHWEGR